MRLSTVNRPKMVSAVLLFALCWRFSAGHAEKEETLAGRLGFEGCRVSKPLTKSQVMAKDMSGGSEAGRAHPDWDELIAKFAAGDQVYFIDCRRVESSRIYAGTAVFVLVRGGVVIARALDTMHD